MTDPKPKGRGFQGFGLNHEALKPFIEAVGKLITNFGALEFSVNAWLLGLSKDHDLANALWVLRFGHRIDVIHELLDRGEAWTSPTTFSAPLDRQRRDARSALGWPETRP